MAFSRVPINRDFHPEPAEYQCEEVKGPCKMEREGKWYYNVVEETLCRMNNDRMKVWLGVGNRPTKKSHSKLPSCQIFTECYCTVGKLALPHPTWFLYVLVQGTGMQTPSRRITTETSGCAWEEGKKRVKIKVLHTPSLDFPRNSSGKSELLVLYTHPVSTVSFIIGCFDYWRSEKTISNVTLLL